MYILLICTFYNTHDIQERHRGLLVVVTALACGAEGPGIEITFDRVSGKVETLSVHPAANEYPALFRAGKCLGGEGRGDGHHPSHAVPIDTCRKHSLPY